MLWHNWPMPTRAHPQYPWWIQSDETYQGQIWKRIDGLWRIRASTYWNTVKVEQFSDQFVDPSQLTTAVYLANPPACPMPGKPVWQTFFEQPLRWSRDFLTVDQAREYETLSTLQWIEQIDREIAPRPRPKFRCGQVWQYPDGLEVLVVSTDPEGKPTFLRYDGDMSRYLDAILVSDRVGEAPWEPPK